MPYLLLRKAFLPFPSHHTSLELYFLTNSPLLPYPYVIRPSPNVDSMISYVPANRILRESAEMTEI